MLIGIVNRRNVFVNYLPVVALILLWFLGLWIGIFCSFSSDGGRSLLSSFFSVNLTLYNFLVIRLLPFGLTAIVIFLRVFPLLYPLAFIKAYCFAFCLGCVSVSFGERAWLVQLLLYFSDFFVCVVLICLWIRILRHSFRHVVRDYIFSLIFSLFVISVDYFVISQLLSSVF